MNSEEIAKIVGVSRSTVSRVINNYPNVPEKTREKVLKAIKEYNYEPNNSARVLAGKQTNTIGLFIVSICDNKNPRRIYQNNYFAPFVDAVIDEANTKDYYVLSHTIYKEEDYDKIQRTFSQKRIDGAIIIGTEDNTFLAARLDKCSYPIVLIDYDLNVIGEANKDHNNISVINSSDYEGTRSALNYLISLGHKDIGIIAGRTNTFSGRMRLKAFNDIMKSSMLGVKNEFVINGEFIKAKTYEEVKKLLKRGELPTAFFSCNDDMALAAMEAFQEEGIRVPEDISIIGFDDVPIVSQIRPALTTIRVPVYDMAAVSVNTIIESIENKTLDESKPYFMPTELCLRDTTTIPRKK
ncbi:LacI family DNA-binding transcriptional regulator [Clostridium sp. 19966]|uniref:LacI family DNA-binding transcriptional regulator n=1 Tax=Clostridium sp. 19966 TaxID=2768166 RepID=UPI0028DDBE5E|nr:LacI family DNA-binding transcriptional regulator [Clostridium sp. 19966]MDT8718391.1 LacI family DNA-binding transcriptional regulator [Clostridium sp. 19966]